MENYAALIMLVAVGCGLLDLLTDRWPAVQRQLFPVVTLVLYTLCVIAYYYGPDIWTYVPYYEEIESPVYIWTHASDKKLELGYSLFCSVLNGLGLSYWWATWVVKTLFFSAIYMLLRRLPRRQILAMAVVVMTDTNLIMHEMRQCLAVAFFIFMVLLMQNRRYILALLCAVLTVSMHKSGFLPVGLVWLGIFVYQTRQYAAVYTLLIIALLVVMTLPVQHISASALEVLPMPESYIKSLSHHLVLGLQFQTIAVIYLALLLMLNLCLSYDRRARYSWIAFTVLSGMAVIVLLYPYYYLLARMRSYFAPFIVYYIIAAWSGQERLSIPYENLIKQTVIVLVLGYFTYTAVSLERSSRLLHTPAFRACTLFELRHAGSRQVRDRQLKTAYSYWTQDYMKNEHNRL